MSANGTELPIPNLCSSVANGGKADKIAVRSSGFDQLRH
jgi:hypothetical protein